MARKKKEPKPEKPADFYERILIFEPHPDDVAFMIGGSAYKWISDGREVMICTVTKGNNSTFNPAVSSDQIAWIMAGEHRRAMEILGLDRDHFVQWDYDDLGMDPARDRPRLLEDMVRLIRKFKPNTVVTMDPMNFVYEENPDHKLVAVTGFEAAAMAAYPNVFRKQLDDEGLAQHFVTRMLFYMSPEPNLFMEISGEPFEKKIQLGFSYASQLDLMLQEINMRLAWLGMDIELTRIPKEELWPLVCAKMAGEAAEDCAFLFPEFDDFELAEGFRHQFLGVVEKIMKSADEELDDEFADEIFDDDDPVGC